MGTTLTVDDIWKLFQETNRLFQESQQRWEQQRLEMERVRQAERAEAERMLREERAEAERVRQAERAEAERVRQAERAETERVRQAERAEAERVRQAERAEAERVLREERAETERVLREERAKTEAVFRETDRQIERVSTQIGQLGGRWGEFVEGLIVPACLALFTARGLQVDEVYTRAKKTVNGKRMEIDILVANTVDAVLVEVKSRLQVEDVRDHLTRLADFKSFFPRYADCRVYGAVAGIVVESEADRFAMNQGLFVIEQSGETVRLANDMAFKPRVW
ncbi:MAG: hypothetical protein H7835_08475 [Magnetococcus sp. XQGC-1]